MKYQVKLVKKELIVDETVAFWWEKPNGFNYIAGQYCEWSIANESHDFTLASAPREDKLMFATRMRDSSFKNNLKAMEIGDEIQVEGPMGELVLENNNEPVVFLAGGIGITPFRSMIVQGLNRETTLLYFNKNKNTAAFLDDLIGDNLKVVPVFTETDGHFNDEMLKNYVPDYLKVRYYLAGTADMVAAVSKVLLDMGIDKGNIRSEDFPGY